MLDKSGFGAWTGGLYFDSWQIGGTVLSTSVCPPAIINGSDSAAVPVGAVDITADSITTWAGFKNFAGKNSSVSDEPSNPIGTTSQYWSSIIVGNPQSAFQNILGTSDVNGYATYISSSKSNIVEDMPVGFVNMITGKITLGPNPTIYMRHEATQRLSPIGRMPFGYHCPIAGFYRHVAPGTQLVQDGRTFIMMGNIAAEMVSV
jgi:hypothetical protein